MNTRARALVVIVALLVPDLWAAEAGDVVDLDYQTLNLDYQTLNLDYQTLNLDYQTLNLDYQTLNLDYQTLNLDYQTMISGEVASPDSDDGRVFNLFIHGRADGKNLCNNPSTDLQDQDNPLWEENKGPYWGRYGTKSPKGAGVPLTRYIGWDTEAPGGAYSTTGPCAAQTRVFIALYTFCREPDSCNIYTHSTGALVVAAFFAANEWASTEFNILKVQFLASAAGGSELAELLSLAGGTEAASKVGWKEPSPELDATVSVSGARSGFNHNASGGLTYYTTSNLTFGLPLVWTGNPLLPGLDDGILANHSLCSINTAMMVTVPCTMGGRPMKFATICYTKVWQIPYPCYKKFYRWDPYYTIYEGGYFEGLFVAHAKAMNHYGRGATRGPWQPGAELPPLRDPLDTGKGLPKPEVLPEGEAPVLNGGQ